MEIQQLDWSKLKPSTPGRKPYLGSNDSEKREAYKQQQADRKAQLAAKQWIEGKQQSRAKRSRKDEARRLKQAKCIKQKWQHNIRKTKAIEKAYQEKLGRKLRDIV